MGPALFSRALTSVVRGKKVLTLSPSAGSFLLRPPSRSPPQASMSLDRRVSSVRNSWSLIVHA